AEMVAAVVEVEPALVWHDGRRQDAVLVEGTRGAYVQHRPGRDAEHPGGVVGVQIDVADAADGALVAEGEVHAEDVVAEPVRGRREGVVPGPRLAAVGHVDTALLDPVHQALSLTLNRARLPARDA